MSGMRILVATDQWYPDFAGGSARVAADSARALARRGHHVVVVAPEAEGKPRVERDGALLVRRVLPRTALPQTVSDVPAAALHAGRLRGAGFDVLVGHQSTTAVGLLAARLGVPLALVYHASALRESRYLRSRLGRSPGRFSARALEPLLSGLERRSVAGAARILVLSEYSESLVAGDHPEAAPRVRRVRGGVDLARFSPGDGTEAARSRLGIRPDGPLLLTVRRLEPRMGLEQLLHAVARLRATTGLSLAVAGIGSLESSLRALSARLGLDAHVRFLGRVSDRDLAAWYRAADLFALPTLAYEGFGVATAEALASGTPVVGTPVGATPELLGALDPRLLAGGTSADDLIDAIARALALAGPELSARCAEYARTRFAWDEAVVSWEAALAEAAAAAAGAAAATAVRAWPAREGAGA